MILNIGMDSAVLIKTNVMEQLTTLIDYYPSAPTLDKPDFTINVEFRDRSLYENERFELLRKNSFSRFNKKGDIWYLRGILNNRKILISDKGYKDNPHIISVNESKNKLTLINFSRNYTNLLRALREVCIYLFSHSDCSFIHAGSATYKGKGYLVLGDSCSGKSTTVANMLRHGGNYLSNDKCFINEAGNALSYPFFANIGVGTIKSHFAKFSDLSLEGTDSVEKSRLLFTDSDGYSTIFGSKSKILFTPKGLASSYNTKYIRESKIDCILLPKISFNTINSSISKTVILKPSEHLIEHQKSKHVTGWLLKPKKISQTEKCKILEQSLSNIPVLRCTYNPNECTRSLLEEVHRRTHI